MAMAFWADHLFSGWQFVLVLVASSKPAIYVLNCQSTIQKKMAARPLFSPPKIKNKRYFYYLSVSIQFQDTS